jgi:hypothetical protein
VWWYLGGFLAPGDGGDAEFYWLAILVRMAGELYLVAVVARDVMWPLHDPVRGNRWRSMGEGRGAPARKLALPPPNGLR